MRPPPITRRRALLGGAAAATAAITAAAGLAIYRPGGSTSRSTADPTRGSPTSPTLPSLTPTPIPRPRGGTARIPSPGRFNFDTFDAQRTGEPSVLEVLGRTHSRLIDWGDSADPQLIPGLAASWEQPDAGTLIFHLDPRARWDARAPTNGRAVTAADVRAHFTRQAALARGTLPFSQRPEDFAKLHVANTGILTVTVRTETDPWALNTFASRYALIQAPESLDALGASGEPSPAQLRGSGAFRFTNRGEDGHLTFESALGGHAEPNLDGLAVFEPGPVDAMLALRIDEHLAHDRRDAAALRADGRMRELTRFEDSPIISTFFAGAPPWNNPALVHAISGALNRYWLSEALFGGRAEACGPISPASGRFAPLPREMERFPGFGVDANTEAAAARAAWDAAGGSALGTVVIDFPSIFDPLYSASSVVVGRLNDVLGPQFRAAVETYTTISRKTADRRYGNGRAAFWFGWGPPLVEPDPSRLLIETYSSTGPNANTLGLKPGPIDAKLAAIARSPQDERATTAAAASLSILAEGGMGIVTWLLQRSELFRWPYLSGPTPSPFWRQHLDSARTLDTTDPAYTRRAP